MTSVGCTCSIEGSPCPDCRKRKGYDQRKPIEQRSKFQRDKEIPRPQAQEAEWKDGLPPVGAKVEYAETDNPGDTEGEEWEEGDKVEILAHRKGDADNLVAICWNETRRDASMRVSKWKGKDVFRPIRTPEQRQRNELIEAIPHPGFSTKEDIADAVLSYFKDRYNLEPKP